MHDYLLSTEWVRFAFVLGIAVSMLLYERRHLTTGSIVVPGYIAVFLLHPLVLVATFLNALVTYALVNRVLRRYVLLYGRSKFTVLAVVSTVLQTAMLAVSPSGSWLWEQDIAFFVGAGYIVPALIAHDMARQGMIRTATSVLLAGSIVAVPIMVVIALDLPGVNDLSPVGGFGKLAFPVEWLPFAIVVSVAASWAIAKNYQGRSGGFVGAAFVGMFMADVWQIAAALTIAAISYLVVTKVLMSRLILFGRRKFSAMLLVSATIAWTALWVGDEIVPGAHLDHIGVGSLALTPLLLPGLLANDAQRTSPGRVLVGASIAATCTVTTTWWAVATIRGQHLAWGWKFVATATVLFLLWPQAVDLTRLILRLVQPRLEAVARPGRVRAARDLVGSIPAALRGQLASGAAPAPFVVVAVGTSADSSFDPEPPSFARGWSAFARVHPAHAAAAERWVDQMIEFGAGRPARPEVDPAPAPDLGSVRARPEPSPATDLEAMALRSLTRLIVRGRTPLESRSTSKAGPRHPSLDSELLPVAGARGTDEGIDHAAPQAIEEAAR